VENGLRNVPQLVTAIWCNMARHAESDVGPVVSVMPAVSGSARLLNRELSWLDFNARLLELAADDGSAVTCLVSEVWDSQERFGTFGQRVMPLLAVALENSGQPEILEVHNIIRR
jgi:Polyphosphate kinase N-terminal domain